MAKEKQAPSTYMHFLNDSVFIIKEELIHWLAELDKCGDDSLKRVFGLGQTYGLYVALETLRNHVLGYELPIEGMDLEKLPLPFHLFSTLKRAEKDGTLRRVLQNTKKEPCVKNKKMEEKMVGETFCSTNKNTPRDDAQRSCRNFNKKAIKKITSQDYIDFFNAVVDEIKQKNSYCFVKRDTLPVDDLIGQFYSGITFAHYCFLRNLRTCYSLEDEPMLKGLGLGEDDINKMFFLGK